MSVHHVHVTLAFGSGTGHLIALYCKTGTHACLVYVSAMHSLYIAQVDATGFKHPAAKCLLVSQPQKHHRKCSIMKQLLRRR